MKKGSDLIGKRIVQNDKKLSLYRAKDILYARKVLKVLGVKLLPSKKGKEEKVILYKNIKKISEESILIGSEKDIIDFHQVPELEKSLSHCQDIVNFEIYTYHHELVGIVKDTLLEERNGKVISFLVSEGVFDDLLNGYSLLSIDRSMDFTNYKGIITEDENPVFIDQKGGLKKLLGIEESKEQKI